MGFPRWPKGFMAHIVKSPVSGSGLHPVPAVYLGNVSSLFRASVSPICKGGMETYLLGLLWESDEIIHVRQRAQCPAQSEGSLVLLLIIIRRPSPPPPGMSPASHGPPLFRAGPEECLWSVFTPITQGPQVLPGTHKPLGLLPSR